MSKDLYTLCLIPVLLFAGPTAIAAESVAAEIEFIAQNIGYPVQYFESVDIEGDGIWELALQVGENGDSVGVYSPLLQRWLDGPHYLPVEEHNWGCGDLDDDGRVDYVYLSDTAVVIHYPIDGDNQIVFTISKTGQPLPPMLQLWGQTATGEPTVFISHSMNETNLSCDPFGEPAECGESQEWFTTWRRYQLRTGYLLDEKNGSGQKGRLCFADEDLPQPYLCVFVHRRAEYDFDSSGHWWDVRNSISLLAEDGQEKYLACVLLHSYWDDPPAWWAGWPRLLNVALGMATPGFMPHVFYHHLNAEEFPQLLSGIPMAKWCGPDWSFSDSLFYAGLASYRLAGYPYPVLIVPQSTRDCWEIRSPYSGELIDSLPGLPPADIRTAPIMATNVLDLYYFLDATLYILNRPGMPTIVLEEKSKAPPPRALTRHQNYPNPFNASTIIELELAKPGPVKLEIYNIVGQKVATLSDEHRAAHIHRFVWNGTQTDGQPVVSGVYFYRAATKGTAVTGKMILLK
jgi:hypothetical protein